jgi:hypothetical protein
MHRTCCYSPSSYGQKLEVNADAYSGLFFFGGNGSTTHSVIEERNSPALATHTANPYGRESGFSDAFELRGQRISKNNLYGLGVAFEQLKARSLLSNLISTARFQPW